MKTYALGDIHGEHDKLVECLNLVNFDYENDTLIQLGDVADRGPKTFECVEELLKIKHLISIKGNHDDCFWNGLRGGGYMLYDQGCMETLRSYIYSCNINQRLIPNCKVTVADIPSTHIDFWKNQLYYYIDQDNNCFVHGGFHRHHLIESQNQSDLIWDRDLLHQARSYESMLDKTYPFKNKNEFKEIFIGHTPVQYFQKDNNPHRYANVWDLDTGCGKGNYPLTIMDVETKQYWQSKLV